MSNEIRYFSDKFRMNDKCKNHSGLFMPKRIDSKIEFFSEDGERIWEPLHNKTVIAGSALTAMKLFNLDRNVLDNTPTYDTELGLNNGANGTTYPSVVKCCW